MNQRILRPRLIHHRSIPLRLGLLAAGTGALLCWTLSSPAGSFFSDFNSGLPAGTTVYGTANIASAGGYTNSGCLRLISATNTPGTGSFVITNDLDAGTPIVGFSAAFKVYIGGGTGADGFSFNFAPDLPADGNFGEEGAGTGITVEFDTFANDSAGGSDLAGIDVKINGSEILGATVLPWNGLRTGTFVDVAILLHPDGTLDVIYDGNHAWTNLNLAGLGLSLPISGGRFGLGARIGGSTDNHWIDNLSIQTSTSAAAFLDYYAPIGRNVRGDAPIAVVLTDTNTAVVPGTISVQFDGSAVVPVITPSAPTTTVTYTPPALLASGSSHTVSITFSDNASPTPNTTTWQWAFTVGTYGTLPAGLAADSSYVDLTAPGFFTRYSQIADAGSRDIGRAELQLANLLIDGSTGLPFANLATPNPADGSFTFREAATLNYGFPAGATGDFPNDTGLPGLPGTTLTDGSGYALSAVTYLHLSAGLCTLGVNSSDGFKLMLADGPDIFAPVEALYDGVRAADDTTVTFAVPVDGYYPFRLVYFTGDPNYGPAPGTTLPNLEFFSADFGGNRTLINDAAVVGHLPAFQAAKTKPYVRSVTPNIGDSGVPGNTSIAAVIVDGSLTVQAGSIALQFNGAAVTPNVSGIGGVYTISYQPPSQLLPNSSNYVSLAFTDSGANRRTNSWFFTVANIMAPTWSIPAVNNTWVTAGSTERGLAYNPKTGHLILVSRAASPAPANSLGIAILDSATGNVLGTMNIGDIASSGVGTFKLNMVDVAEDGVIYVCNLTTSGTVNFRIYRWQDENAAPQLVWDALPLGGATRCGDDFRVRGSGAGTQIIASGNSSVTTIPIFTTTDGTNFTGTALNISGIAANMLRLGLAFGCGNEFYGETTGQPMSHVGFTGLPSTAATLLGSYGIFDKNTNQSFGPIGIDIASQRLIANSTVAPHSITVYDLPSLVPTPARNFPLDQRNYASQNSSFGTGSIDFAPDGSHVYCLDTGNGIIAFSLAPKPAPPVICAQPQNFLLSGLGAVGFMDVSAVGAPQHYQWGFSGVNPTGPATPINNATNRTLDLYNVQQSQLGWYSVVITNPLGSVTSAVAYLDTQMVLTTAPADQVVPVGGSALFTVAVSNGVPAYAYQWQFFGSNISGATTTSLAINNAQVADAGAYSVVVTDILGQSLTSGAAILTVGIVGSGTGLAGDYYNVASFSGSTPPDPFDGPPAFSTVDPTVNFDWGTGVLPSGASDYVTIRWHGQVQPLYSQTYTFYTTSDDGSRLWLNNQLVVDNWYAQPPTERSGTITLVAYQKYDLLMEYFERAGGAVAMLSWSSANQAKQIIPMTQLYPSPGVIQPLLSSSLQNGTNLVLNWSGTFVLESAPEVAGPWTPLVTNVSPFTVNVGLAPQMFYRLLNQD